MKILQVCPKYHPAIGSMVVEAIGLSGVKFSYTGGERGWRGNIPQVRFDITKMGKTERRRTRI